MLRKSRDKAPHDASMIDGSAPSMRRRRWLMVIGLPLWTLLSFAMAQLIVAGVATGLRQVGVRFDGIDSTVLNSAVAAVVYALTLLIVIGVPRWTKRSLTTRQEMGLSRQLSWKDMLVTPVAFIIYLIISGVLVYIASKLTGINTNQMQEIAFSAPKSNLEYILTFITLVIMAPLAEEAIFRGYLFGKLKRYAPAGFAVVLVSLVFGSLHLPAAQLQWNVALDTFALSLVLCVLRLKTGSIWAGVLLHMVKNGLAFYFLFINPVLMHTIGGS